MTTFNTTYLNRTPNKTARVTQNFVPEFVIMHETAGYGSLEWNLKPEVRSSYNYLITRDGTIYHYVDERKFISWHAGVASSARGYRGGEINVYAIGIELEGPNDGTPITPAQRDSSILLILHLRDQYQIPIAKPFYIDHKEAAPTHKIDPKGYSTAYLLYLTLKADTEQGPAPGSRQVIGVTQQMITLEHFDRALVRHDVAMIRKEREFVYNLCVHFQVCANFLLALAKVEDATLGKSELQSMTHVPINRKTAFWKDRPMVRYNGSWWEKAETEQIGWALSALWLKNGHGSFNRLTIASILYVHAPPFENDTAGMIRKIEVNMNWTASH